MRHRLGNGSESLSTARRMELNQRSCNSAMGQLRTSSLTVILKFSVRTNPMCVWGTAFADTFDNTFSRSLAETERTIRDCDSLKRRSAVAMSVEAGVSPAKPTRLLLQFSRLTCAPSKPSGLKQHSASARASPPSEQSCALL